MASQETYAAPTRRQARGIFVRAACAVNASQFQFSNLLRDDFRRRWHELPTELRAQWEVLANTLDCGLLLGVTELSGPLNGPESSLRECAEAMFDICCKIYEHDAKLDDVFPALCALRAGLEEMIDSENQRRIDSINASDDRT